VNAQVLAPVHINAYLMLPEVRRHVRGAKFPWDFRGNARVVAALNKPLVPWFWSGKEFDIIHETYYSERMRGRARMRILTIYDMIHELYPGDFPNSRSVSTAKRSASLRADHVICISETTRKDAVQMLGIPAERCSVIYLGCSLETAMETPSARTLHTPYILYVGPRSGYKNYRVVLEAFSQSIWLQKNMFLVAFGGRAFSEEEGRQIREYGLTGRVRHVSGNDFLLSQYYKSATAFVYPSRYEGFGIPPLEAMSSGCPVVCSNAGSILEILGDAASYFEPDDGAQLRVLLERVSQDKQFADDLRNRGYAQIMKYSWKTCAEKTVDRYADLLRTAS